MLRGLTAAAGALVVLIVAAALWGLLGLLGDEAGAHVSRGVALAAGGAWLGALSALVLLLVWDRIAIGRAWNAPTEAAVNGVYDDQPAA
jgi:hypothetical protein